MTAHRALAARSVAELVSACEAGESPRFLFFWSHRPRRRGELGQSCLSQWWPVDFVVDDVSFRSAEHFMMWHKARLFGDENTASRILDAPSPGHAKALGREVRGFDEATWVRERWDIVVAGSLAKFAVPELRSYLVESSDRILVEASPHDRVWGIGVTADDQSASDPTMWRGLNLLGFALMEARDQLQRQEAG